MPLINFPHKKRKSNRSGVILIAVLWVLVILTMLTTSIGRNTSIELSLTKYAIARLQAKYLAWGGLVYAMNQIRQDSQHEDFKAYDTLYSCAIVTDEDSASKDIFSKKELENGYFEVVYDVKGEDALDDKIILGMQDEERKINLNTLTLQNYKILKSLIEVLGFEEDVAEKIAAAVIDWKDEDSQITNEPQGAEDDYYMGLNPGYHIKNKLFDSVAELLLVKGMTMEIYEKLKEYVTIFPREGQFTVNFDTASEIVLKALSYSVLDTVVAEKADADSMVMKLIEYRRGEDGVEFTKDDRVIELSDIGINAKERVISLAINPYRVKKSNFIRIQVNAVQEARNVEANIESIVKRDDLSVVYWKRQ